MYFHGEHGPFRWLQSASLGLGELLRDCPQTVVGKFVVVTAFDGGPLELSGDEVAAGWRRIADQAHSPHINNPEVLPHDSYDEWYLFAAPATPQIEEVFINYGGFSLLAPQAPTNWDPSWDRAAEVASQEAVRDQQDRFWLQMARSQAESYLAEGDNLICVTRDVALHTSWLRWAEERAEHLSGLRCQEDERIPSRGRGACVALGSGVVVSRRARTDFVSNDRFADPTVVCAKHLLRLLRGASVEVECWNQLHLAA